MNLSLEVMTDGKQKGKRLPITLPQFVIGRDPQCHLRPASPSISKRHCAILQREDRAFVRDFDSTNGTFVNDRQIKGEIELQQGDRLRIGPILFTVHLEAGTAVNQPTPPPPTKAAQKPSEPKPASASAQGTKTPMPPTKQPAAKGDTQKRTVFQGSAAAAAKDSSADDDIAAMLLEMGDESSSGAFDQVPEGSTVMDLTLPPGVLTPDDAKKEKDKDKEKPKPPANTQSAAKDILEKYMKRPR